MVVDAFFLPFLYGCDPPPLHIASFFLGMIHLGQSEINSFLFILDTWKELSMCTYMGLMVAIGRGQSGKNEGCTNVAGKPQRHRYLVSLYVFGKYARSIQLKSEKVRVVFPLQSPLLSCPLSAVVFREALGFPVICCSVIHCLVV